MRINLAEIKEEGEAFSWNNKTGEVNKVMSDLIGQNPYQADFFIKPLNSKDFELRGSIKTATPEQCARCGNDINFPIDTKFVEFLIPKQDQPRGGHYSKVNHVSESQNDGPDSSEYEGQHFDMGEYLHEVVALSVPFNPKCPPQQDGKASTCEIPLEGQRFSPDEKMPSEGRQNPFAALKNMKLS